MNHFAAVRRSKPANDACGSPTEDSLLSLHSADDKRWFATLLVVGNKANFILDVTGSTANVLPVRLYRRYSVSVRVIYDLALNAAHV